MTDTYTTPHVHKALSDILKGLSVEKKGSLPSNMGGKPYISATDLFDEVKTKLADSNLIFAPIEKFQRHEVVQQGQRVLIATVIEGAYTFISTEDGSSLTVVGVGDGLATGSAVSSNIASTNALKNALLRTFLAAETSVEDKAKNGVGDADESSPAQAKITKAAGATPKVASKPTASTTAKAKTEELRNAIREKSNEVAATGAVDKSTFYFKIGDRITGQTVNGRTWVNDAVVLQQVLDAIKAGEVE